MIFSLSGIAKAYPTRVGDVTALDQVSFEIDDGERVALIGPSGAGKTSLFRLIQGTMRPTRGTLRFHGEDVQKMSAKQLRAMRRTIGTIFQQPHLVSSKTVLENAVLGRLGYWSVPDTLSAFIRLPSGDKKRAEEALERVELAEKRGVRADELSGGQKQRLAIARVLVQSPAVILADEPFASLDPALVESMAALLMGLWEDGRRTLVFTLHDTRIALEFFPRIIGLRGGRIAFDLPAQKVSPEILSALYASEREERNEGR